MSSELAKHFHSVNFGDKNTWDDWKLIPIKRPVIEFPAVKTLNIDIPAGDGEIDLSESLTGFPTYENRKGSLKFRFVDKPDYDKVLTRRNRIASFLHGKTMRMILDEEPQYFYSGRYELEGMKYKGKGDYADVEINYNVRPYKFSLTTSASDDWLWDPFNFETGIIQKAIFSGIEINSENWYYIENLHELVGDRPANPTVTVTGGTVYMRLFDSTANAWGTQFTFAEGSVQNPAFVINYRHSRLAIKGVGTVSINFRTGVL